MCIQCCIFVASRRTGFYQTSFGWPVKWWCWLHRQDVKLTEDAAAVEDKAADLIAVMWWDWRREVGSRPAAWHANLCNYCTSVRLKSVLVRAGEIGGRNGRKEMSWLWGGPFIGSNVVGMVIKKAAMVWVKQTIIDGRWMQFIIDHKRNHF